jgi:hypothetical protein
MANNHITIELEQITNSCFVVMPFHSLYAAEYERVIKPAVQEAGLECVRGDEIYTQQSIVHDIWKSIRQARVIVAELSSRNPNVMYEVGLAHAIGKPIVLLTRSEEDVPFDLRALRYIFYDPNDPLWGEHLRTELTKVLRKILESPSLSPHLGGVRVQASLPQAPLQPNQQLEAQISERDFSGVWQTSWLSIKRQREHRATLVIPPDHARNFVSTMTVDYDREGQRTIVQETLSAIASGSQLSLTGVNYTYVEQGSTQSYSLDNFDLQLSDDGKVMRGKAQLRHGEKDVVFQRLSGPLGNKSDQIVPPKA